MASKNNLKKTPWAGENSPVGDETLETQLTRGDPPTGGQLGEGKDEEGDRTERTNEHKYK